MDAVNKQIFLQMLLLGVDFDTLQDCMLSHVHGCPDLRFDCISYEEGGKAVTVAFSLCQGAAGGEVIASPIYEVRVFPRLQAAAVVSRQVGQRCIDVQDIEDRINIGTQTRLNVDFMCWLNECCERGHHFWVPTAKAVQG